MRKLKKKPILIFTILIIALYVVIYVVPKVTGALVSSYIVEYGDLMTSDETTGYFVRNEQVYVTNAGGKINPYIKAGTLVRRGTTVMEITGNYNRKVSDKYSNILTGLGNDAIFTDDYSASMGGVVSYYADGCENRITPETMEKKDYNYYSKLNQKNVVALDRENAAKGEPVFKVVDRTKWYIVCFVSLKHQSRYEIGAEVTVNFEDDYVNAEVYRVDKSDDKVRVILETDYYYDNFDRYRVADVSLITDDVKGLIIENSSIVKVKGQEGVYVKNKTNDYDFVPVNILMTDGEKSVVSGSFFYDEEGNQYDTIEPYDYVLKKPQ